MNAARPRRSGGSRASSKLLEFCDLIPSRSRNRGTRHQQTYRKQRSCLDYVADEPNKTKRPRVHGVAELAKKGGESQERHALWCCLSCRRRHKQQASLLAPVGLEAQRRVDTVTTTPTCRFTDVARLKLWL